MTSRSPSESTGVFGAGRQATAAPLFGLRGGWEGLFSLLGYCEEWLVCEAFANCW